MARPTLGRRRELLMPRTLATLSTAPKATTTIDLSQDSDIEDEPLQAIGGKPSRKRPKVDSSPESTQSVDGFVAPECSDGADCIGCEHCTDPETLKALGPPERAPESDAIEEDIIIDDEDDEKKEKKKDPPLDPFDLAQDLGQLPKGKYDCTLFVGDNRSIIFVQHPNLSKKTFFSFEK